MRNLSQACGNSGVSSLYRGNECYARIHYKDWGRHVVGWVRLDPDSGDEGVFYFGIETPTIKDAIRVLNDGLKPVKKTEKRIRTERPKFEPQRKGKRNEGHVDQFEHDDT